MNRFLEPLIVVGCLLATIGTLALHGAGGAHTMPASVPGRNYLGQYVFSTVVTLVVVSFLNRRRQVPLNRWRAVMLVSALVILLNFAIVVGSGMRRLLTEESYVNFVADVSAGGWLVLLVAWPASYIYRRSRARAGSTSSAV